MTRRQTRAYPAATLLALLVCIGGTGAANGADPAEPDAPRFVDVAAAAGIEHAYTGDWTYYVGGGVAAFDCDLDDDPDLFFAGGASPARLYRNDSAPGALRFSAVADSELVETGVTGAYPLDIDGDGMMDLAVLRQGANRLYRGLGDCRFARADEAWGVPGGEIWTTAFSAVWEGDSRLPTLAFGNYVDRDMWAAMHLPFGDSATGEAPTPACPDNVLFRPADANAATYGPAVRLSPGHCPLSMLFSDWSRTGRPDLRVSNDRFYHEDTGEEQLWHLGAEPRLYGRADGWPRLRIWGMGIASHDLTGDGLPDYFLSNMGANRLRTLAPGSIAGPAFREIAFERGVEAKRPHAGDDERPSTAWHSQFADVNNDGWIDLFVAKGNVEEMEEAAADDPNNLLLGGPDGRFREASVEAGAASMGRSRGGAVIDLDLDGLLDIVVVNRVANVEILHNRSRISGHWLEVMLHQEEANRNAIGAWIEVRAAGRIQRHEVVVGGGHVSGQAGWIHFGLGAAEAAEVRVQWPDGTWSPWQSTAANRFLLIERGRTLAAARQTE
ncbi:MAG: CRTAC1 family protein [Rhodospirillales bacterium]|nr:CRTAC1 family protein [Rhodospirillales bacterium]